MVRNAPSHQMNVADHSGSQWLTCFQDTGMEILGKSAAELGELRDQVREREVREDY